MTEPLQLNGLDGANPLGFLAALGTLALCDRLQLHPRMSWRPYANSYRPMLWVDDVNDLMKLAESLDSCVQNDWHGNNPPPFIYNDIIACLPQDFRELSFTLLNDCHTSKPFLYLASGFGSDANVQTSGNQAGLIEPSLLSFANRQSERKLLEDYAALVRGKTTKSRQYPAATAQVIYEALSGPWRFEDDHKEFRWSPDELRQRAYSKSGKTVHGANLLAFWSLMVLASFPTSSGLSTSGFQRIDGNNCFTWPLWDCPLPLEVVRSLIHSSLVQQDSLRPQSRESSGVMLLRRSFRIAVDKGLYFTHSVQV